MTATTPDEPTSPLIDAVAVILCKRELRKDRSASFDDIVAPGRELWMRYRYEATDLLDDLERAGLPVAPADSALHLDKIDLAHQVFVVNPVGYIGESTRREIAYAESLGKPVLYLVPESVSDPRSPLHSNRYDMIPGEDY